MKYFHSSLTLLIFFSHVSLYSFSAEQERGSLQTLLQYALKEDPRILEAKANVAIAESQTNISKAGHYPVISVENTQVLSQHYKDSTSKVHSRPSLKGQVNLFAWGAIEGAVERDKHKEEYFRHKKDETKEQVGKTITELYLTALQAKATIEVYKKSLKRHQNILKDIKIISSYDEGRAFEVSEAESRVLQTESIIEQQSRILHVTISKLNRYTRVPLTENDLRDPFYKENPEQFIAKYKNPDLFQTPTFLAQQKELDSAEADIKVAKAQRLPAVNLEGQVYNKGYNVYLGVSWNVFDSAADYSVEQSYHTKSAAQAKLSEILLELEEQARSSEIDMKQNSRRLAVAKKQIVSQQKVVNSTELQFEIAQRSLLDVLNSYKELAEFEVQEVNIQNDFRIAALNYLVSQARIAEWAGIKTVNLKF